MPLFVAGLLEDRAAARRAVRDLLEAGVPSSEISLAARERTEEDLPTRNAWGPDENPFQDLAIHSAWERLGWQGGARPPYRDRVPPKIEMAFIAAGPVAIAIGGAQLGAASGGLLGAMNNFGFPLELGRAWYDRLVEGKAWVMVRCAGEQEGNVARAVLERHGADERADSYRHW